MPTVRPDFSFDREGRPLSAWLLDLVSEDAPARLKAGDVLQGMQFGVPYGHTELDDLDWEEHCRNPGQAERFAAAVREAVDAPGFPRAEFVRRLILYRMMIHADWVRRVDETQRRAASESDEYIKRIGRRLEAAGDDAERAEPARRLCRWFCASVSRGVKADQAIYEGAEAMSPAGFAASLVFDALDVALLADRPGLRLMLDEASGLRWAALQALERIGPPAADFAPELMPRLDDQTVGRWFDAARALGSIGCDDPATVDALLTRLASPSAEIRGAAAACLAWAGPPLAGRVDEAVDLLLEATRPPSVDVGAIEALAALGRDREGALARVLDLASPQEPRWVVVHHPTHDDRFDEAMRHRGVAIAALRHFRSFADEVMPILVDAIDTFEEYDPDESYGGDHARVCETLAEFGPAAAPAVSRLAAYLESWRERSDDDGTPLPSAMLRALRSIGPSAAAALPVLEAIRFEHYEDASPELDRDEPLDGAILAIRGS